jgi:hypothetical protein
MGQQKNLLRKPRLFHESQAARRCPIRAAIKFLALIQPRKSSSKSSHSIFVLLMNSKLVKGNKSNQPWLLY